MLAMEEVDVISMVNKHYKKYIFIHKDKDMSKGERLCKRVIERISKRSFTKVRPNILVNPKTNRNLELDLYNDTLKIAVEYNGIQHYEYTKRFHKTYGDFRRQQERDALKKQLCKDHGVFLIVVTYNCSEVYNFITNRLLARQWTQSL